MLHQMVEEAGAGGNYELKESATNTKHKRTQISTRSIHNINVKYISILDNKVTLVKILGVTVM